MNQRYKKALMWVLFSLLFLAVMLLQTAVFGRLRFYGVKLNLIPVVLVCISMQVGHEAGGTFSLLAALLWSFTGADDGALGLVSLTVCGILAGYLCDSLLARKFFPALALCLGALLLHEGARFLLKFYLDQADPALIRWVPLTAGLSLAGCPVIYLLSKAIGKAGEA